MLEKGGMEGKALFCASTDGQGSFHLEPSDVGGLLPRHLRERGKIVPTWNQQGNR